MANCGGDCNVPPWVCSGFYALGLSIFQGFLFKVDFFSLCPLTVGAHSKMVCVVSEDSARLEGQTGIKL